MFICSKCHPKTKCTRGSIEGIMRSYGPCEMCDTTDYCMDCKGY